MSDARIRSLIDEINRRRAVICALKYACNWAESKEDFDAIWAVFKVNWVLIAAFRAGARAMARPAASPSLQCARRMMSMPFDGRTSGGELALHHVERKQLASRGAL